MNIDPATLAGQLAIKRVLPERGNEPVQKSGKLLVHSSIFPGRRRAGKQPSNEPGADGTSDLNHSQHLLSRDTESAGRVGFAIDLEGPSLFLLQIMQSPYVIPDNKRLIIVDAHDTILKRDLSRDPDDVFGDPTETERVVWVVRDGLLNFIEYYAHMRRARFVISSDGNPDRLRAVFEQFGIARRIHRIYGRDHLHPQTYLKQLDIIARDAEIPIDQCVFIGDSRIDALSAENYGVDFIRVPGTLEDATFSFNEFLRPAFARPDHGLEIQKITNLRQVKRNLSTPELVEEVTARQEGRLLHLGALAVESSPGGAGTPTDRYVVKEPASAARVYWEGSFQAFDADRFEILYLRLLAFLQDRELYIQDCAMGSEHGRQYALRVITQTAWHSLFTRNCFVQVDRTGLGDFLPEFTIIHVPHFKAIPDVDGTTSESFLILHLARKLAVIGGTSFAGELRRAAFNLTGYYYAQEDLLPTSCSSNRNPEDGSLFLYFGLPGLEHTAATLARDCAFFGDAHHVWTRDGVFNLEWGCYEPADDLDPTTNPVVYTASRRFATILENVRVTEHRRAIFSTPDDGVMASFPITHIDHVDRGGAAAHPRHVFVLVRDTFGAFPALARLTPEQTAALLLLGYDAPAGENGGPGVPRYRPFFDEYPLLFHPAVYAVLLWERLRISETQCWLVASGSARAESGSVSLVARVRNGKISEGELIPDPVWNFSCLAAPPGGAAPEAAIGVRTEFQKRLHEYRRLIDPPLVQAFGKEP